MLACSGGFPLQHSSLVFLPQIDGSFQTCLTTGVDEVPSNFSYGADISQQLLSSHAATIDLGGSGASSIVNCAINAAFLQSKCTHWSGRYQEDI